MTFKISTVVLARFLRNLFIESIFNIGLGFNWSVPFHTNFRVYPNGKFPAFNFKLAQFDQLTGRVVCDKTVFVFFSSFGDLIKSDKSFNS
jgi:hypothetical protein